MLTGQTALSTPQPGGIPAVHAMWSASLAVADACYVLLVLAGGIVVMSHETVGTFSHPARNRYRISTTSAGSLSIYSCGRSDSATGEPAAEPEPCRASRT